MNINNQTRPVRLYGVLGSKFGRVHHLAVSSAAEAIRALGTQLRGFDAFLTQSKDNGIAYAVFYGKSNLTEEQLYNPAGQNSIRIAPILMGSKNGGWLNIIVGAVLVAAGYILSPFTGGASLVLVPVGYAMIAGGIVQLLSPAPKGRSAADRPENQPSYTFNGPINTQAQGNPVMVSYGENMLGSAVLSAGINSVDQAYVPSGTPGAGSGGGGGGGAGPWHKNWELEA
jgi:predicted phage tail protein